MSSPDFATDWPYTLYGPAFSSHHPIVTKNRKRELNAFIVGGVGGAAEASSLFWLVTRRNCRMLNQPLPTSIPGYYRGFTPHFTLVTLLFSAMHGTKSMTRRYSDWTQIGFSAGSATLILLPAENTLVRMRMRGDRHWTSTVRAIFTQHSWHGFYVAGVPGIIRNLGYCAGLYKMTPSLSKSLFPSIPQWFGKWRKMASDGLSAGVSGATCALATEPIDVIKMRMHKDPDKHIYKNMRHALKKTIADEGFRVLWTHSGPRMLRFGLGTPGFHFIIKAFE